MSTTNIRKAIDAASDMSDHPNAPVDLWETLKAAIREVEQIECAAVVLGAARVSLHADDPDALADACDLMERIAKEAP